MRNTDTLDRTIRRQAAAVLSLAVLMVGCSSVGKHEPFLKHKEKAAQLKTESTATFALEGIDLASPYKGRILDSAKEAAEQSDRWAAAIKAKSAAKAEVETAKESLEQAQAGADGAPTVEEAKAALSKAEEKVAAAEKRAEAAKEAHEELVEELGKQVDKFDIRAPDSEEKPFNWGTDRMPSYLELKRIQAGIGRGGALYERYADLLHQLANPGLIDGGRFEVAADSINEGLRSLLVDQLGVAEGTGIGLIAESAVTAAKLYIKHKQARFLKDVLEANQKLIAAYSTDMQEALVLLKKEADKYYRAEFEASKDVLVDSTLGEGGESERATAAGAVVTLDAWYSSLMEELERLRKEYQKLPDSHAQLAKTITSPGLNRAYIDSLGGELATWSSRSLAAAQKNRYHAALTVAKRSDSLAKKYERMATKAEAETALALSKFTIADSAAKADPMDKKLKKKAQDLQAEHLKLKAISDGLRAKATYYRSLANIDKTDAAALKPSAPAAAASGENTKS